MDLEQAGRRNLLGEVVETARSLCPSATRHLYRNRPRKLNSAASGRRSTIVSKCGPDSPGRPGLATGPDERPSCRSARRPTRPGPGEDAYPGQPVQQIGPAPFPASASAVATACSLITSRAASRPTPARTAAISTLVVARNAGSGPARAGSPPDRRRTRRARSEGLDLPVDGKEAVRQRDSAHDGAEHVAFVPLRPASSAAIEA